MYTKDYLETCRIVIDREKRFRTYLNGRPADEVLFMCFQQWEGKKACMPLSLHDDGLRRARKALKQA
jgi:hypothetical protein